MKRIFKIFPLLLLGLMACGSDEATPSTDNNSSQTNQTTNNSGNKIENGGNTNTDPSENQTGGNTGETGGNTVETGGNTGETGGNTGETGGGSGENPGGEEDPIVISLKYPSYLNEMAQSQSKVGEETSDGYTIPYDNTSFYVKINGDNATLVTYTNGSLSKEASSIFQFPNYVADKDGNWIPVTVLGDGQQAIFKEGTYFGEVEVPENVITISDNSLSSLGESVIDLPATLKTVGETALSTRIKALNIKSAATKFTNLDRKTSINYELRLSASIADAFAKNNSLMTVGTLVDELSGTESDTITSKKPALSNITTTLNDTWIDFKGYIRDAKASAIKIDFTIDFKNKRTIFQATLNGEKSKPKAVTMDYNKSTDTYKIVLPRDASGRYRVFARYNDFRQPVCFQGPSVLEITEVNKLGGINGLISSKTFDIGEMKADAYDLTYKLGDKVLKFRIIFMEGDDFAAYASSKEESGSDTPTLPVKPGKQQ